MDVMENQRVGRCWGRTRNLRRCGREGNWLFFCEDHRLQPVGLLVFTVFTIVAGTASIYSAWFAKPSQETIAHQTRIIASLKQLVAPLDEQITADLFFTLPAGQPALASLARYLDTHKPSPLTRYISLPQVSSAMSMESTLATFVDSDISLSYCRSPSCKENAPISKPPNDVDLSAQIKIHKPLNPVWLEEKPHYIVVPLSFTGESGVVYDSIEKLFTVSYRNRRQIFFQFTERLTSADDLPTAYLFVQRVGPPSLDFRLKDVTLYKKNGKFLVASEFKTISVKNHTCQSCGTFEFFSAQFPPRWQP